MIAVLVRGSGRRDDDGERERVFAFGEDTPRLFIREGDLIYDFLSVL